MGMVGFGRTGVSVVRSAIAEPVPAPILSVALAQRFASRGEEDFANKVLSALACRFGVHPENP